MVAFENYYCHAALSLGEPHQSYHDNEYGFPAKSDNELFKRLMLEVNQAGLSWTTILNKKEGLIDAYDSFEIEVVANYTQIDRERLLTDSRVIRNKLKINAAIHNANRILEIQREFGSFENWLNVHFPKSKEEWVRLFKKTFKFTGGEITNEFLISTGYLKGAHHIDCPTYHQVVKVKPKWLT
ncbi:MAG: DNA-3-methyladenine glycosylase I [Vicingaceae bacterium]